MDKELAEKVIDTARFYMSGDNCQPFRYRFNITTQTFHIDYLAEQAKHTLAYDDYTITLSLGVLLEYLEISLNHHSFTTEITFNFGDFSVLENQESISAVKLVKDSKLKNTNNLYHSLKKRITNRNPYQLSSFEDIDIDNINKNLRYNRCSLLQNLPKETTNFFASSDCSVWLSKRLGLDIMNSVSFMKNPVTGLPWRNLGLNVFEVLPIKLIQFHHRFYDILKALGSASIMKISQHKLWRSSNAALVFTFNEKLTFEQKTIANKEMARYMLQLTSQGYAFQPSTLSVEMLNLTIKLDNNLISASSMKKTSLISDSIKYRQELGLKTEEVQWILRIGKPIATLPEEATTNRLPVSTILSFEE